MGKSSKKSTPKVDVAPAITAPAKSGKKGKREAEEALEKQVSVKKQKRDEAVEQEVQKQKNLAKTQTKKEDSSSAEDSSSSDSDSDQEVAVKAVVPSKKQPITKTGNGTVGAPAKKGKKASSESSDSTESDSDEDNVPKSKMIATLKNLPAAVSEKKKESSESSDSDSSSDEETVKSEQLKKLTPAVKNGSVADDNSDSETSSDEDDKKTPAKTVSLAPKKKAESSDSSDGEEKKVDTIVLGGSSESESSEDDDGESSESESDEDDDANAKTTKSAVPLKRPTEVKESKQPVVPSNVGKPSAKTAEKKGTSSEDSSDDSSDDEASKTQVVKKKPAQVQEESSSSEEEESEEEGSEEESEEDQPSKTSKKRDTDVDMVDAVSPKTNAREVMKSEKKAPKTPVTPQPQTTGTKTLFVGNLSFQVERDDVVNFFKDAGEVVDVRFSTNEEGRFKGFGHVEFATAEAANKALELNNEELLNRPVRLDLARERGSFTPYSGKESNSFQKGGRGQVQTIFVRGFDKSLGEDGARSALEEHFGSCGEISRISIPVDYETGSVKGIAYMDFNGGEGFNKALELNGSEFGENYLTVEEAKPRGDNRDGAGSGRGGGGRGRSGGRDSGGRFGGRRGGRGGSGGRFGGGGSGGRFGGGGRGRGTPNKPSMAAAGTGKKTTFDD